jgi:hypothetical protein
MKELMGVGTRGTNLFALADNARELIDSQTGNTLSFADILDKPLATEADIGDLRVKHMIAVDFSSAGGYSSIYGKVFINGLTKGYDDAYMMFVHYNFVPSRDAIQGTDIVEAVSNGFSAIFSGKIAKGQGIANYGVSTIPGGAGGSGYFFQNQEKDFWMQGGINKSNYRATILTTDGTMGTFSLK